MGDLLEIKDLGEFDNQIHTIFLLPCEKKISSMLTLIYSHLNGYQRQFKQIIRPQINFDKTSNGNIDVTFFV